MHYIKKLPGYRSGRRRNMVIATIGYVFLALVLYGLVFGDRPADEPAPPAAAVESTETVAPEPTATAAASPTSAPTPTPVPTPTPDRSAEIAERRYLDQVTEINDVVVDALQHMAELSDDFQPWSDRWVLQMAAQLVKIRTSYADAQQLDVPPKFAEVHAYWLDGLRLLDESTYLLADGIDHLDASLIEQAAATITEATARVQEATARLKAL